MNLISLSIFYQGKHLFVLFKNTLWTYMKSRHTLYNFITYVLCTMIIVKYFKWQQVLEH